MRTHCIVSLFVTALVAVPASASGVVLTFDGITNLSAYASLGVTFSSNASVWTSTSPSVLQDPNGGPYSAPNALQFGSAGGVLGSVYFSQDVDQVSIWALSGPGPDLLNTPMYIKAYDIAGNLLAQDDVDASLQFDQLTVTASAIRRVDCFSPVPNHDVWDDLSITFSCPAVVTYCTAGTTTNGCSATISGVGTPSASAASGFQIAVQATEGQKSGIVFYGINGRVASPWFSGTSFLCVKSPVQRMTIQNSGGTAGVCNGAFTIDWNAYMTANPGALGQPLQVGQIVDAQAWFRDPPAPEGTNLSDALEFSVCP